MICLRRLIVFSRLFTVCMLASALLTGCGASRQSSIFHDTRELMVRMDDFGLLLVNAGLAAEAIPTGKEVTVADAERLRLMLTLALADGSMQRYGPRVTADLLLAELIAGGKATPRSALDERLRRFEQLAVLRPDGYLASVSTGMPVQCVGPIQVKDGALTSGRYKVGAFYFPKSDGFQEVPDLNTGKPGAIERLAGK